MTWFRVDDKLGDHPKVRAIPRTHRRNAMGLWVLAGSWCASNVLATDGRDGNVPGYMLDELCSAAVDAAQLVRVALWHAHGHDCESCEQPLDSDGWIFHEWASLQYTAAQVRAKHDAEAERSKRYRERRKAEREAETNHASVTRDDAVAHGTVRLSRPDPTRPVPLTTERGLRYETFGASRVTERPEDARCTDHDGVLMPPACRGCMIARETAERQAVEAKRHAAEARRNCRRCHGSSLLEDAAGKPIGKCDHRPLAAGE